MDNGVGSGTVEVPRVMESRVEEISDTSMDGLKDTDGDDVSDVAEITTLGSENKVVHEVEASEPVESLGDNNDENGNVTINADDESEQFEEAIGVSGEVKGPEPVMAEILVNESAGEGKVFGSSLEIHIENLDAGNKDLEDTGTMAKGLVSEDKPVEAIGSLENDTQNLDVGDEGEQFEEAIGVSGAAQGSEDTGKMAESLVGSLENDNENLHAGNEREQFEEAIGVSGEAENSEEILVNEADPAEKHSPNGVMDEHIGGFARTTDSHAAGETQSLNDGNDVNNKLPENGVSNDGELSPEGIKTGDVATKEEQVLKRPETDNVKELTGDDSSFDKPCVEKEPDTKEVQEVDNGSVMTENGKSNHLKVAETLIGKDTNLLDSDTVEEQILKISTADGPEGSESLPLSYKQSSEDISHVPEENITVNGNHGENSVASGVQHKHDEISNLKKPETGNEESMTKVTDSETHKDIADSNTSAKNCVIDIMSKSVHEPQASSAESVPESSGSSHHDTKDANPEILKIMKDPEEAGLKAKTEDKAASENKAQETKAVAGASSSSMPLLRPGMGTTALPRQPASRSNGPSSSTPLNPAVTPNRPAGLGRAAPLLDPASRVPQQPRVNGAAPPAHNQLIEDPTSGEAEEYDETREKLQMIRVKFLRLAHRLGQTPHNVVVAQVLYRLGLAEQLRGRSGGRVGAFSFDRASAMAEQLEAGGQEPLDFTCTIMVLGKTGVGKSATINSIFDEPRIGTDAFQFGTKKVQDVVGMVQGIRVRIIDTPGLLPSWSDQRQNEKILRSVKQFIKKTPPDIVLYLDRLDMQSRDFGDMPLLRTITDTFGPSIWFNAIVVLTHAASAPPEGPNGTATSYDMFVTQRTHVVQQAIRQAAGDMRLMNPVSLVENHSACRTNRAGQRVLPNGQIWKPHLLLLSFASKILAEANTLLKLQDSPPGRPFNPRAKSTSLPYLLSSLLQSRPQVKLPSEQYDDDSLDDDDLDEGSDSDDESEYDELPPFKPLTKSQLEKLSKLQRKAYYDELEYREKLFMKKQLKEEKKRRRMMKKMQEAAKNMPADINESVEEETSGPASVPVLMPDLALPASFDSDNPTHRYRYLDSSTPWLVRPVLEPNGWDHDIGYEGINIERLFVIKEKVPISCSGHFSKDKKESNLQMEIASSVKHEKGKVTSLGFDMQSVGKDMAYTLRTDTTLSNRKTNKASAGLSTTLMGDVLTGGLKIEDKLVIGKRGQVVVSGGAVMGRGEVAYGGSLEATLKDKDHPLGRFSSTFGLSVMDWHGDLAIGCNSQTQIPIGRHSNLIGRLSLNNRGSGQVSVRVNSSEQLQIALISLIPLVKKMLGYYYQQPVQYG